MPSCPASVVACERLSGTRSGPLPGGILTSPSLVYCFDIDGTLCTNTGGDYNSAQPFPHRVKHVNDLYAAGHTIKLFTARGSSTGIDWSDFTRDQLNQWGVKYHELILGKPHADVFIDDKAISSEDYSWSHASSEFNSRANRGLE
jgi:hypothetical protein